MRYVITMTICMFMFFISCGTDDPASDTGITDDSDTGTAVTDDDGGDTGGFPEGGGPAEQDPVPDDDTAEVPDEDDGSSSLWDKEDADGDGIPNGEEGKDDTDGDGTSDFEDADTDGDGIPDETEAPGGVPVDTDEDGAPDYKDTDSDGDGIPDAVEGTDDTDGDGAPNYRDTDSDGDGINDAIEAGNGDEPVDTDGDDTPDYLDTDTDNDGVPDGQEGVDDHDMDGVPNFRDNDADGDGIGDGDEYGDGEEPRDTDEDKTPDFLDLDSDNDGLTDEVENTIGSDPLSTDTDGDGFDDNVEYAYGEQVDPDHTGAELVSDDTLGIPEDEFYVVLPYQGSTEDDSLDFRTDITAADVVIQVDLSGSMSGEIDNLKSGINSTIITGIQDVLPDTAFGLITYDDYRSNYEDLVTYVVNQPVTTNTTAVTSAVNAIDYTEASGLEPHIETLYQTATGEGFNSTVEEVLIDPYLVTTYPSEFAAADCSSSPGGVGGACFRDDSLPIFIMMTDEYFLRDFSDYSQIRWKSGSPQPHTMAQAIAAMNDIDAKFIGVYSDVADRDLIISDYNEVATGTNSLDTDGNSFLFSVSETGTGLSDQIVDGVEYLLGNLAMDVTTEKKSVTNDQGIDTRNFISALTPTETDPADSYESVDSTTFYKVKPGTTVFFDVVFENTVYEPTSTVSTLFRAKINVVGAGTTLDTREVLIIVPGKAPSGDDS